MKCDCVPPRGFGWCQCDGCKGCSVDPLGAHEGPGPCAAFVYGPKTICGRCSDAKADDSEVDR